MVTTDEGTYEFYFVVGYKYSTRGEMFSDYLLYESMGVYDTYNKLTVIVYPPNPAVCGWNVQDLYCTSILGQENICEVPFDNGECEFTMEMLWPEYGDDSYEYLAYYSSSYPKK